MFSFSFIESKRGKTNIRNIEKRTYRVIKELLFFLIVRICGLGYIECFKESLSSIKDFVSEVSENGFGDLSGALESFGSQSIVSLFVFAVGSIVLAKLIINIIFLVLLSTCAKLSKKDAEESRKIDVSENEPTFEKVRRFINIGVLSLVFIVLLVLPLAKLSFKTENAYQIAEETLSETELGDYTAGKVFIDGIKDYDISVSPVSVIKKADENEINVINHKYIPEIEKALGKEADLSIVQRFFIGIGYFLVTLILWLVFSYLLMIVSKVLTAIVFNLIPNTKRERDATRRAYFRLFIIPAIIIPISFISEFCVEGYYHILANILNRAPIRADDFEKAFSLDAKYTILLFTVSTIGFLGYIFMFISFKKSKNDVISEPAAERKTFDEYALPDASATEEPIKADKKESVISETEDNEESGTEESSTDDPDTDDPEKESEAKGE